MTRMRTRREKLAFARQLMASDSREIAEDDDDEVDDVDDDRLDEVLREGNRSSVSRLPAIWPDVVFSRQVLILNVDFVPS